MATLTLKRKKPAETTPEEVREAVTTPVEQPSVPAENPNVTLPQEINPRSFLTPDEKATLSSEERMRLNNLRQQEQKLQRLKREARLRPSSGQLHETLKAAYPAVFAKPYRPLKLGIHKDLMEAHPEIDPATIRTYIAGFVRNGLYCESFLEHTHRYDLNGKEAGEIDPAHVRIAIASAAAAKNTPTKKRRIFLKAVKLMDRGNIQEGIELARSASQQRAPGKNMPTIASECATPI